jgi:hypothetical protein
MDGNFGCMLQLIYWPGLLVCGGVSSLYYQSQVVALEMSMDAWKYNIHCCATQISLYPVITLNKAIILF